jgi:lysophospholipase L1-like esterase
VPQINGGVVVGPVISAGLPSVLPLAGNFPFLHRALGQVQAGLQDRTILHIGDSITEGVFADLGMGPVPSMVKYFNGAGINSQFGLSGPAAASVTLGSDARWANGSGWTFVNPATLPPGWGNSGCAYQGATGAGGNLTYAPGTSSNQYDVYYYDPSTEGFTVTATGGSPVVVTTGNTGTMKKVTCIAAATSAFNVVTFSAPTGFGCTIYGVDARLTTTPTLRIGNVGAIGSTAFSWNNSTLGPSGAAMIGVYAPDVSIISLGVNDVNTGVPVATYLANLAILANVCKASGDVFFWSEVPIITSVVPLAAQTAYYAALKGFCAANGYGFFDTYTAWGTAAKFAALNTDGYYVDNLIHPSVFGQNDLGRIIAQGLLAS